MLRRSEMSTHREPHNAATELDDDMAAFEAGLARIEADLRARHPELFDESGELRTREVMRLLIERAGGKTELTKSEFLALMKWPAARPSDAT
jgi:hypothetical protein